MKPLCLLCAILLLTVSLHAQSGKVADDNSSADRMTNKEVMTMVSAGISTEVILSKIQLSRCTFDTNPTMLAELKHNGVPDEILMAMIKAPYGRPEVVKPKKTAQPVEIESEPDAASDETPAGGTADLAKAKELAAAEKIISALRRMDNAVAVGVTFQNYSSLLIENKSVVDENLNKVSDPAFRRAVESMMFDHQYAMSVWNLAVANGWTVFFSKQQPGRTLITRYGVPIKISIWTQVPVMTGLNHVWLSARNHFNIAANIHRQMGEKQ